LWNEPRAIITPHVANPRQVLRSALRERITDNVSRFASGSPLVGLVDLTVGY
jgi:phosphoglycerate dehydrogenase-like enzyme